MPVSAGSFMERHRVGNSDLTISAIGLGCYGMSEVYGPADDAESIATIRRALDLGVNFLDTSASYGAGHNHRLIGEAIRGRRHDVVIHSKSGSPRDGGPDAVRGGGDPRYLRQTCEQSLKNLGIETLDVFCMSRVDPNVPIEESVGGMAELVKEGKTRFISLSECSAESLKRGSAVHPLTSLQMEYSLFSRDAEEQGQIDACKELGMAMMAYAVLGRGMLSDQVPKVEELAADDVRESHVVQRRGERPLVVEELMAPGAEGAVDGEAAAYLIRVAEVEAVVRRPDPVEIRCGEAQHAVIAQHAAALAQQCDGVRIREMFDEVLGEDERDVVEGEALRDVQDLIDAFERLVVDVDPACQMLLAGAEV